MHACEGPQCSGSGRAHSRRAWRTSLAAAGDGASSKKVGRASSSAAAAILRGTERVCGEGVMMSGVSARPSSLNPTMVQNAPSGYLCAQVLRPPAAGGWGGLVTGGGHGDGDDAPAAAPGASPRDRADHASHAWLVVRRQLHWSSRRRERSGAGAGDVGGSGSRTLLALVRDVRICEDHSGCGAGELSAVGIAGCIFNSIN